MPVPKAQWQTSSEPGTLRTVQHFSQWPVLRTRLLARSGTTPGCNKWSAPHLEAA